MTLRPRVTIAVLSPGVDLLMYFLDKKTSDFIKHKNTIPITPMGIKKMYHYSENIILFIMLRSPCVLTFINSGKCKSIDLSRIYLAGVFLEYVERYKYLGLIIHVRNDDYATTRQLRTIILRTNILLRTLMLVTIRSILFTFMAHL